MFVTVSVDVGIYGSYRATNLRTQVQRLPRPQASLFEGIQQLPFEPNDAAKSKATIEGIMSDPNFRAVVHALENRSKFEELAEPKVITTSGRQIQGRYVWFDVLSFPIVTNSPSSTSQPQVQ
jgi:hypothetical protein